MKKKHVYFYAYHGGEVKSYEGYLTPLYDGAGTGWFVATDEYGIELMRHTCLMLPGELYYRGVWFTNPQYKKAIDIFQAWEQMEIAKLQERIDKHERNINLLGLLVNNISQPAT